MKPVPGLLLAGGRSKRMGEDKALLPFGKGRLVDHGLTRLARQCTPVYLNAGSGRMANEATDIVPDDIAGFQGPLAGIVAGLSRVRRDIPAASHMLTAAVDTPFFPPDLAATLAAFATSMEEIVVAADPAGNWHPTFALWPVSVEQDLREWLKATDNRKLRVFISRHPHRSVSFPLIETASEAIDPFFNINTPEDYRRALSLADDAA